LQSRRKGSQISLGGEEGGEGLLVVEAPVQEGSVPSTPGEVGEEVKYYHERDVRVGERDRDSLRSESGSSDGETGMVK
jgi:hypothetical protein